MSLDSAPPPSLFVETLVSDEASDGAPPLQIIFAHGWGQSHLNFMPVARALSRFGARYVLDFPGFGRSPPPPAPWGTAEYADAMAAWLGTLPVARRIWVGHSFGCRVGLQLAARHPGIVDGLFLLAAAGLQRRRSLPERAKLRSKVLSYKLARRVFGANLEKLPIAKLFGSADYRSAGEMRQILSKVVREDLSEVAGKVSCPVHLVYGAQDVDTPPEIGERLVKLIPDATISVLPRLDHHTVMTTGLHQVEYQFRRFVSRVRT